jgi:PAS domain S-box-containing protein
VQEEQIGVIEVCYLEERPASDEGVFLHEERYLIDAIAERLEQLIERRRADEAVRESKEKLSSVVETANQAIISADSRGRIIAWNRAAEKIYGYTADKMISNTPAILMPERTRESWMKSIQKAMATGKLNHPDEIVESVGVRKDGAEFPVEISFTKWEVGGETFFTTIISDITERKKASEALRKSEEKYRLISENTSDLIAVTTFGLNPTATYVSPSHRMLGYEPEDLIGKSSFDFIHPDDKKKLLPLLKKYAGAGVKKLLGWKAQGFAERIEYRIKDKWGNWHYLESDVNLVEDHILFISRDITERKKVEEALRESEERHRILFEEAPDGYYLHDLKGNFIDGNRRAEEITGYKKKELIGKSFLGLKLLSAKEIPKAARLLAQNVLGLPTGPDELTLNRKDGSQVPVEITTYPIKLKGQAIVLGIARDITERKKAEEKLEEYYESVKFLSETAMGFVKLAPDVDICKSIGENLKNLIGKGFVLISSFDAEAEEFTTRAFAGDKKGIEASFKLIGRSVVGARFPITPEARRGLTSGKLEKVQGVFELSGGGMPRGVCNAVEKLLGLGRIYAMGFSRKDELYGSAIILLPKGVELKDKNVVETFINQASVTLQRRQVEQSLKESEEKFRTISASAQDAIIMLDNEGNLSYWNEAAEGIFGYAKEEVLGKEFHTLLIPETYHELYKEGFARFSKTGEGPIIGKTLELSGLRKDGSQFPVELSVSSVKIKGKWHAIGILRDITERKQAELQLQERARLLDSVRKTNTVDGCLQLACEAVRDAGLFARAVFTIKNEKGKTTHLAQVGLPPELVERLDRTPPASKEIFKHMIRPEFKISHSYFVPREAEVNFEQTGRYIAQDLEANENPDSWKKGDELFVSMLGMDGSTESYLSVDTPVNGKRPDKATILHLEDIVDIVARQIHEIYNVNVLRESEERYRAFTEEALVGVYIYQQGKYLLVNRAMAEITGYSEDELLNMEPQTHSLPGDRNSLDKRKEIRKQDTKGSMEYTINIRRKNGETAVLEVRVRSIPYGEKVAYLGNCIDITERVRQREQIEQAREKWERTFDSISDLVMIVDPEGRIQKINKAVGNYTGLDLEDLRGKNYLEVFHPGNLKNVREFYTKAIQSKVPASFEIKDPEKERVFWVSISPLFSQSGNTAATVAVARDITDMRRIEKALMESEIQFRGLAESAQDIIFSIDVDGSILYLNPAFQESLGEDPKDFIGTNIRDLFGEFELNADTYKNLNEYLENPEENPVLPLFDLEVRDKKNRKHVLEISVRFLSGQFIGIARDVTERKRMEQQLLRASKFASIGVLAAGLGHQVNNPLASILATSTALREMLMSSGELSDTLGRKMDGYLTAMERQLDRTHRVVSSLLEFAKEKKMDVMSYNVNHMVREALQFISQHLSFKDISLELLLDENLPLASVDREALQQTIINVVQNAFEAMEGRGKLAIETETGRGNIISISISNDGPVIPAEIRDEIFELLFTTKTAQKGTGLGLPISAMLLEHFDARLYLEDSRDDETIFVIEVPIQVRSNR